MTNTVIEKELDEEGILTITLNRPEKLNALNSDVLHALQDVLIQAKKNKKVKGLIITGSGKAFCAGADINRLAECNAETGYQFACDGQAVFKLIATLGKPSIAAVNGYAFGGGCELAIATTLRIAATAAKFGQPEITIGTIPGAGGTQRLTRFVGKSKAMDLCLTGRFIDADTALQWGLVSEVIDTEALLVRAKEVMRTILAMAPLAVASVIDVIEHGFDMTLDDALHLEAIHFAKVCASEDKQEGVDAFLTKRTAAFKGA
jgi:enoyl-CoA hydratase